MNGSPTTLDWLPELITLNDFGGDWNAYIEAIYEIFKSDFIDNPPVYEGTRLGLKRHPISNGKEATFWHMTSTGANEDSRVPDLRRCERMRWPKPVIEIQDTAILTWVSEKKGDSRIHLWLEQEDYLVVLAERRGYLLPWTAYLVERDHTKRKLRKEFERYSKAQK